MDRPPSKDDEQPEQAKTSYPHRRRQRTTPPNRLQRTFYSDEHPEIPKIRRASLHANQEQVEEEEQETTSRQHARPRPAPREHPASGEENAPRRLTPQKIMVSQRRRHSVYQPPRTRPYTRHPLPEIEPPPTLKARFQKLSQDRNALIIGSLLLATIILAPIIIAALVFNAHYPTTNSGTSGIGAANYTPLPGSQPPADPHVIVITPPDTDHPAPPVFATSAYLLDADTGATLYAHNPFMHLPMLSTTKLMTAVVALDEGKPDQKIIITAAIDHDISQLSADSSLFGIKKGETYSLRDLLYGLLLMSGNDSAIAIADSLDGNTQSFVAKMNQRANQLGLYDTHYMNPHGLLATGQFSSAHDLAILGRYSMSIPLIHQIVSTQIYHIPAAGNHPNRVLVNGNQFLWWYPGVDGGKPGWDGNNNFVQVISCTRNHHHLIGVVMHTNDWWTDMRDLMNWGFNTFSWISPYDVDFQHQIPYDTDWNFFAKDKKENTVPTADQGRYYIYTGYSISGPIMAYFDKGGGLKKFGYPKSIPTTPSSNTISQLFDHGTIQCDLSTKQCTSS